MIELISHSAEHTEAIGRCIGNLLKHKVLPCIVLLYGDLGAGKTTLIKGIASALGLDSREVGSASFVIVAEYEGKLPLIHIDLYRIDSADADEIGLWDYLSREAITVIEWADRVTGLEGTMKIKIVELDDSKRIITIEGTDEEDRGYLQAC
jgi:tRNA threonylcarbamoyladenosine biosynthesis protein TsaE